MYEGVREGEQVLIGFRAQNHRQQVGARGARLEVDCRVTPPELFDPLNTRFGFTLDVAASPENAKCARYFTMWDDGLAQSWAGERVWCNPPYSNIGAWIKKAQASAAELVVMLLPANRTEQRWWQDLVEPHRDGRSLHGPRVEFIPGRVRFFVPGDFVDMFGRPRGGHIRPPFGVCLLIWQRY